MDKKVTMESSVKTNVAIGVGAIAGIAAKRTADVAFDKDIQPLMEASNQRFKAKMKIQLFDRRVNCDTNLLNYFNNYEGSKNIVSEYNQKLEQLVGRFSLLDSKFEKEYLERRMSNPIEVKRQMVTKALNENVTRNTASLEAAKHEFQMLEQQISTETLNKRISYLTKTKNKFGLVASLTAGLVTYFVADKVMES